MRSVRAALVAVSGAGLLVTAGMGTATATSSAAASHVHTYTHRDTGKTVKVKKGHTVRISLTTCTDCGDSWQYTHRPNSAVVKVLSKHVVSSPSDASPQTVGGYSHTVYRLRAEGKGKTTIRLVEQQAGEPGAVSHFRLTFKVPAP